MMPPPPTVAVMRETLEKFNKAVDAEQMTAATVFAAACTSHLERVVSALESGDYALVRRDEMMALLRVARAASHALKSYQFGNAAPGLAEAVAAALDAVIATGVGDEHP
jgi:hypothetical protein